MTPESIEQAVQDRLARVDGEMHVSVVLGTPHFDAHVRALRALREHAERYHGVFAAPSPSSTIVDSPSSASYVYESPDHGCVSVTVTAVPPGSIAERFLLAS